MGDSVTRNKPSRYANNYQSLQADSIHYPFHTAFLVSYKDTTDIDYVHCCL